MTVLLVECTLSSAFYFRIFLHMGSEGTQVTS